MMPTASAVIPPSTVETEQALLGAVLINPEALDRARDHVVAADFFDDAHRQIFQVMCDRRDAGDAIDFRLMKVVLWRRRPRRPHSRGLPREAGVGGNHRLGRPWVCSDDRRCRADAHRA